MESKTMTYKKAAIHILSEEREPMNYGDIADRAIERGLISPKGETPKNTMQRTIGDDIKLLGEDSQFYKASRGMYGLKSKYLQATRLHIGKAGEFSVAYELMCRNCTVYRPDVDDTGIDIIALKDGEPKYIQVKAVTKKEGNYVASIDKKAYNRAKRYGTDYVLVLRDSKETVFAILLAEQVEDIFAKRPDGNSTSYPLTLTREEDKLILSTGRKKSDYVVVTPDDWDAII